VRRLAAIAVLALAAVAAFLMVGAKADKSAAAAYKVQFDNAFGLFEGGDFRVGGVTAGSTKSFEIKEEPGKRPVAEVEVTVKERGFGDFYENASCDIKPQSLIGEYFVDCQPGDKSAKKIPTDGSGVIPVKNTTSTVPQDLVNNILRTPYRDRLRLIISSLGAGLAGRPQDLQSVLRRAHPGLRETTKVLRTLGDQNATIERFIADSDRVVGALNNNKQDVVRWVRETGRTAAITATRRRELTQSFQKLPGFLDQLTPTMARLENLTDAQRPLLGDLRTAAPDLTTFFNRLGPFAEASRPAIRSLGRAGKVGTKAFKRGKQEVDALRALAPQVAPTAKPLRQFLQGLDDRGRSIEDDNRAKLSAPPAPDKTAIPKSGGFTGFEAFWNYFWWQTWSLNGFDKFGHILRVSVLLNLGQNGRPACSNYVNDASDPALLKECNQWLGPYQPGLKSPDFTDGSAPSSRSVSSRADKPAARAGERRSAGQPDAGPVKGQRDISKPQIVLPPDLQRLVDQLPAGKRTKGNVDKLRQGLQNKVIGQQPENGGDATQDAQLLDYLLAP
jgi:virulence factor Mce-like protein